MILAAGYATRLYPLTQNFPKPLLKVGEKTILDWLLDDIDSSGKISEFVLISNHKFAPMFEDWAMDKPYAVTVVDDMTSSNETRLGAVCDMEYAIKSLEIDDDILVIAGDNVLDFSLTKFIDYAEEKGSSAVMRYSEESVAKLQKCGVLSISEDDLVTDMEEKPATPKSHWCCPPFYYYKASDASRISEAISEGCGTDAPGSLVMWMCKHSPVHAMEMPGPRYDVGNLESYEKIKLEYKGISLE